MLRRSGFFSVLAFVSMVLLPSPSARAELTEIGDSGFSGESVWFDFSTYVDGTRAHKILGRWGIAFVEGNFGIPEVKQIFAIGQVNGLIQNTSPSGSSAGKEMMLNFEYPVKAIGFVLENGTPQTVVTFQAFDTSGKPVGELQKTGMLFPVSLAFGTSLATGISKFIISYGADSSPEQLDDLKIDFVTRPTFANYLAQVGDGPLPGSSLQTTIVVSNLTNSTAAGELAFFNSAGNPLQINIGGEVASSFDLSIPAFSSKTFETTGTSTPIAVGYAIILTNTPVEGTAIFRIVNLNGTVKTEAGVGSTPGSFSAIGAVQKKVAGAFDSGIAVVNTTDSPAMGTLEVWDETGNLVATNGDALNLAPRAHKAAFLSELFPLLKNQDFKGTIRILSNKRLAVVILRTGGGLVLSSLPVGSLEN